MMSLPLTPRHWGGAAGAHLCWTPPGQESLLGSLSGSHQEAIREADCCPIPCIKKLRLSKATPFVQSHTEEKLEPNLPDTSIYSHRNHRAEEDTELPNKDLLRAYCTPGSVQGTRTKGRGIQPGPGQGRSLSLELPFHVRKLALNTQYKIKVISVENTGLTSEMGDGSRASH